MKPLSLYSGGSFTYPECLSDPSTYNVIDIAHALSRLNRYAGHSPGLPLSVAEHSVMVANEFKCLAPIRLSDGENLADGEMAALLHDASEAYLIDLPSPLKKIIPEYQVIEDRVQKSIFASYKLKLSQPVLDLIREIDIAVRSTELTKPHLTADEAKIAFLERYIALKGITR